MPHRGPGTIQAVLGRTPIPIDRTDRTTHFPRTEARMARMARFVRVAALGLAITGFSGCVSQEKYNALRLDRDSLAEQLGKAQTDASSARAEADAFKNQLGLLGNGSNSKDGLLANLTQQNATLQAQLDALNQRYAEAMNRPAGLTALPQPL